MERNNLYKANKYFYKFKNASNAKNQKTYLNHMNKYCQNGGSDTLQKISGIIGELEKKINGSGGLLEQIKELKDEKQKVDNKINENNTKINELGNDLEKKTEDGENNSMGNEEQEQKKVQNLNELLQKNAELTEEKTKLNEQILIITQQNEDKEKKIKELETLSEEDKTKLIKLEELNTNNMKTSIEQIIPLINGIIKTLIESVGNLRQNNNNLSYRTDKSQDIDEYLIKTDGIITFDDLIKKINDVYERIKSSISSNNDKLNDKLSAISAKITLLNDKIKLEQKDKENPNSDGVRAQEITPMNREVQSLQALLEFIKNKTNKLSLLKDESEYINTYFTQSLRNIEYTMSQEIETKEIENKLSALNVSIGNNNLPPAAAAAATTSPTNA